MKTITIDPLARVEGNGGIQATIDGKVVTEVKFTINEGPRLIEKLILGRTPEEDTSMSPRICAICSCSHKNGVLRALENALDVEISHKSYLLRELMHMGEFIESHALHTFYLALPDFLHYPNAIAMALDHDLEGKIALEMKHFGNRIMKAANGRYIHGENAVIGGFGKYPSRDELLFLKSRAIQFMPFVVKTVDIFCGIDYPDSPDAETVYACCEPGNGQFGFWGDEILLSTGETIPRDDYQNLTNEFVVSHSYAKHSLYQGKSYSVGALARINNLGERLTGEAEKMLQKYYHDKWKTNPFFHNAARSIEIMYAFERIPELVDEFLKIEEESSQVEYTLKDGKGTGLVEAPRGLLIHHHEVESGLVSYADIITPTAQNAEDIEKYCQIAAQSLLDSQKEDQIANRLDIVVRAFDPCISCSAHMAEVKQAPTDDWRTKLEEIKAQGSPVYIGVGNPFLSDDGAGIELAQKLRQHGLEDVWLESDIEEDEDSLAGKENHPIIFLDAVDFKEAPGKITIIPLHYVLQNTALSHKFLPAVSSLMNYRQLDNSYLLGIQPDSLKPGNGLSSPVQAAANEIVQCLKSSSSESKIKSRYIGELPQ
jgi:sulfhydrogenase subunit alpha